MEFKPGSVNTRHQSITYKRTAEVSTNRHQCLLVDTSAVVEFMLGHSLFYEVFIFGATKKNKLAPFRSFSYLIYGITKIICSGLAGLGAR